MGPKPVVVAVVPSLEVPALVRVVVLLGLKSLSIFEVDFGQARRIVRTFLLKVASVLEGGYKPCRESRTLEPERLKLIVFSTLPLALCSRTIL